jgi:hypothetical protein
MTEEPIVKSNRNDASIDGGFFRDINVEFLIHELKDPISVIETAVRMLLEKPDKCGPLMTRQEKTLKRALRNSKKARILARHLGGDISVQSHRSSGATFCLTLPLGYQERL